MLAWKKHYAKKYPGSRIHYSEGSDHGTFEVHDADGKLRVRCEKSGFGIWKDVSADHDALDSHHGVQHFEELNGMQGEYQHPASGKSYNSIVAEASEKNPGKKSK